MKASFLWPCLAVFFFSGCDKGTPDAAPTGAVTDPAAVADFATAGTLQNFTPIQFNNLSTGAQEYRWNFGDGGMSTQVSPAHTFRLPGAYNVQLEATGPGGTTQKSQLFTIRQADTTAIILDGMAGRYRCTKISYTCYLGGCPTPQPSVQACDTVLTLRAAQRELQVNNLTPTMKLTGKPGGSYWFFTMRGGTSPSYSYSATFNPRTDSLEFKDSYGGSGGGQARIYYGRKM